LVQDVKIWNVGELLRWSTDDFRTRGIDNPRLDAELLLGHATGLTRIQLIVEASKELEADALARFLQRVQVERGDFNGRVMTIRHDDLRVIGATFGRNVSEMLSALDEAGILYHD